MEINEDILIRYIDGMLTEEEAAEVKNWRAASLEKRRNCWSRSILQLKWQVA